MVKIPFFNSAKEEEKKEEKKEEETKTIQAKNKATTEEERIKSLISSLESYNFFTPENSGFSFYECQSLNLQLAIFDKLR
jgi:hypothetical protein